MIKHICCIIHFMQHNFVFQLTFYPFQDKINKLPLRICYQIQFRYSLDTDAILLFIQIHLSDIVQIRSRHGCHSDTHLDFKFRYSSDTLQTRMPFWYSFKFQVQIRFRHGCHSGSLSYFTLLIQYRYAPDTDAILFLIQISSLQIQLRYVPNTETIMILILLT